MTKARILADYVAGGTTAAEFDYMDGVTSNVQTQMDAKAPTASPTFTGTPVAPIFKLTPTATSSAPTGAEGLLYFDSDKNALMQYDGTEWLTVSRYSETGLTDATGGVITQYTLNDKHYRIHAFYTSGVFTLKGTKSCDVLLIGGGGGGGGRIGGGGGGGAVFYRTGYSLTIGTYNITIGAGGYGGTQNSTPGSMGGSTIAFGVTAYGGGPGKTRFATNTTDSNRANGGGGSLSDTGGTSGTALSATGWTYEGGYGGGNALATGDLPAGGGGGAAAAGQTPAADGNPGGNGGAGTKAVVWITPMTLDRKATAARGLLEAFYFAGGGGGSGYGSGDAGGAGGIGGGGGGSSTYGGGGTPGDADLWEGLDGGSTKAEGSQQHGGHGGRNSGGGGGAGCHSGSGEEGGNGGSGVAFIRYEVSL